MNNNEIETRKKLVTRNLIKKVIENIENHDSQLGFEKRIYNAHKDGIDIGNQSHSRTSYSKIVKLIKKWLKNGLIEYAQKHNDCIQSTPMAS
jgi:hypothetical protein